MMTLAARRAARTATARMGSEVVFIASESRNFHAKHHAAIFMLEIVAMEQIRLRALKRHREAECHTNALPGPDEHRVLAAEIGSQSAVFVDCKRVNEIRRRFPLEYLEMKAMQMHRVRHAGVVVAQEPDFRRIARDFDRRLTHDEDAIVDPPAA